MSCHAPLRAWRKLGQSGITFKESHLNGEALHIACGQCTGCRIDRSKQWAVRILHEKEQHDECVFITLTYDDDHLPEDGSLNHKHFQDFMKRLRFKFKNKRIRFYMAGEYGSKLGRPHYHAILFGVDFKDKVTFGDPKKNHYVSATLQDLWGMGYTQVGNVTYGSAAYVARYIMKKITGEQAENHYYQFDETTGEAWKLKPEYNCMSRRPGIASSWYEKYKGEVEKDEMHINGKLVPTPKYYLQRLKTDDPEAYEVIKGKRKEWVDSHPLTEKKLASRQRLAERLEKSRQRSLK